MGVEAATFVNDLDETLPEGTNPVGEGDNHLRLLKEVLQNTFPTSDRPFYFPDSMDVAGNVTLSSAQVNTVIRVDATAAIRVVTLPPKSQLTEGDRFFVTKTDNSKNHVVVSADQGTIEGQPSIYLSLQFQLIEFVWSGTLWVTDVRKVTQWVAQRTLAAGSTLTVAAFGRLHYLGNAATAFTTVLPTAIGYEGAVLGFRHIGTTGTLLTLDGAGAQTIEGEVTFDLTTEGEILWLVSDGAGWKIFNSSVAAFSPGQENIWTEVQIFLGVSLQLDEQTLVVTAGTAAWDLELGNSAKVGIAVDTTFAAATNKRIGQFGFLRLIGTADDCDLVWNAEYVWLTAPIVSSDEEDITLLGYYVAAANIIYVWNVAGGSETSGGSYTDYDLGVPAISTVYTQAHGLSAVPSSVQAFLKSIIAEGSVLVGDYINASDIFWSTDGGNVASPLTSVRFNATNVITGMPAASEFENAFINNGTTQQAITFSNYHLVLRVFS
jgi:hypothetical protein